MSSFVDANVLITGGAGGLGRELAKKSLQRRAAKVLLWDVDEQGLQNVVQDLMEYENLIYPQMVDLTQPKQIYSAAKEVLKNAGPIDILINNAGMVIGKKFEECSPDEMQRLVDINISGVLHTTRAFLPKMIERGSGHVVVISSAAALMGNPRMSVYAGSKWAITGWAESLRLEMDETGSDVKITTVQPSYIDTGMFKGVRAPVLTPILRPRDIAQKIINAVITNKAMLREPFIVKLVPFLKGVLPAPVFDIIAGKLFRVYKSMETFEGNRGDDE